MSLSPMAHETSFVDGIVAAVRSVVGSTDRQVALHQPEFAGREWDFVKDCLDTGWVSSAGPYVDRFERDLATVTGVAHAIATSSGTAALHICLLLAGVRAGDEVLMSAVGFIATANAVSYVAAVPHFVESDVASLGIDATKLDAYLSKTAEIRNGACVNIHTGAVIRALVPVHVFGHPVDLDALCKVAHDWNIVLVEDAAESLGSRYKGKHTGNHGLISACSFNGNKVVTTGGGGAILTNDAALARRAKHLTTTARVPHQWNFIHDEVGYNYRMPNINAALGCAQLEQQPRIHERKRALATRYARVFTEVSGVRFLTEPAYAESNYWLNAIVLDEAHVHLRDLVLTALNDTGYMSRPLWTLLHTLPMYTSSPRMDLAVATAMEAGVVCLPSSAKLGG
jgi:perosamine synthetase